MKQIKHEQNIENFLKCFVNSTRQQQDIPLQPVQCSRLVYSDQINIIQSTYK